MHLAVALLILAAGLLFASIPAARQSPVDQAPVVAATEETRSQPLPGEAQLVSAAMTGVSKPEKSSTSASLPLAQATPQIPRMRDPDGDQTPDLSDYVNAGERPSMSEVIDRLHQAGVYGGLGAFSPPGTRPPLIGLAVPDGFELPPGYVRHYQSTDDGQRIEPILMFSPDHAFVDANGQPIAIPSNRVVPPELAPPGMPIRTIVIPAPSVPGK